MKKIMIFAIFASIAFASENSRVTQSDIKEAVGYLLSETKDSKAKVSEFDKKLRRLEGIYSAVQNENEIIKANAYLGPSKYDDEIVRFIRENSK